MVGPVIKHIDYKIKAETHGHNVNAHLNIGPWHNRKASISVAMAIKISHLDNICMVRRGLLQKHFCKAFAEISAVTNAAITTRVLIQFEQHTIYVEVNVIIMYAEYRLHYSYGF